MPTAILIGFEYKSNILPGAIIDLYHSYKWCKSFSCEINILTDITQINDKSLLSEAIENKIAKKDLFNFYEKINPIIIYNNFISKIIDILMNEIPDEKLIIYYSGHGLPNNYLVMPDGSSLQIKDFKNTILNNISSTTEVFFISDCCNSNCFNLPYKLNDNIFGLSSTEFKNVEFVEQKILLITSGENHEKSISTSYGSLFTRYLFQLLGQMNKYDNSYIKKENIPLTINRNLRRLAGNLSSSIRKFHTGYPQNVSIYSSYMIDPILWTWIGNPNSYDVIVDETLNNILVRETII